VNFTVVDMSAPHKEFKLFGVKDKIGFKFVLRSEASVKKRGDGDLSDCELVYIDNSNMM
jgi:hypothetical protein